MTTKDGGTECLPNKHTNIKKYCILQPKVLVGYNKFNQLRIMQSPSFTYTNVIKRYDHLIVVNLSNTSMINVKALAQGSRESP